MQKAYNSVEPNDWASALLLWVGLDESFARTNGRVLRIMLGRQIVKNHVEQGLVNMNAAVVFNKPHLTEAVHEETHPGSGCPDHIGQGFLSDPRNHRLWLTRLPEIRHEQENSS